MGNDGGSIPTRRELVKEAARNPNTTQLKEKLVERQSYHWSTDPLTNKPLVPPIVSDCTGILYNKDSILEFLLPAAEGEEGLRAEKEEVLKGNVRSLKDVVEVKLTMEEGVGEGEGKWTCPITNKALGPGSKAVYLVPCGHAFVSTALKEIADSKCPQCEEAYAENDVISIIPTEETEIARLLLRVKTLREQGLTHSLKKAAGSKKRKKGAEKGSAKLEADTETTKVTDKASTNGTSNGIKSSAASSVYAKVLAEQEDRRKKQKKNENLKTLFTSNAPKKEFGKNNDFMTRGYAVPTPTAKK